MQWYQEWFDNLLYDDLYKHRDDTEAKLFCKNITKIIDFNDKIILDLCCGKGRLIKNLYQSAKSVYGIDLTQRFLIDIKNYCKEKEIYNVNVIRADIKSLPFRCNSFDVIINFFTSFGYFDTKKENNAIIADVYNILKPNGIFIFDYLNIEFELPRIKNHNQIDNEELVIEKSVIGDTIIKRIFVKKTFSTYYEKIKIYDYNELKDLLQNNGFKVFEEFGNYELGKFDIKTSPRIIFLAQK